MTEDAFWRCTFRKLSALLDVHIRINAEPDEEAEPLTLEELLSWG